MNILRDFSLTFEPEAYIEMHGERFARLLKQESVRTRFEEMLAEIPSLCEPVACYEIHPIEGILHDKVVLAPGVRIGGGPVVEVVRGADELVVAVCTVGPAVDERIRAYQMQQEAFKVMLLDELASWAVDQVRQQVYHRIEQDYGARGWHISALLSPGESTWSVEEQPLLFALLDAEAIGVTLTDSCVMRPLKSLSMIFGVGREAVGVEGLRNCDFCTIKDKCRYARMGGHGHSLMPS